MSRLIYAAHQAHCSAGIDFWNRTSDRGPPRAGQEVCPRRSAVLVPFDMPIDRGIDVAFQTLRSR
jgi:hypothetical protein